MTGVQDGNAAREIEILTAFDIPHPTIFPPARRKSGESAPRREEQRYDGAAIKALLVFISDSPVKGLCTYI
ncbi:Uncharacterised protein [Salmonella enterica subsp. enterica]|uniref:Uncharacterized protein n=1 Tax=Salmonella enterica I TaxID=59201 RepID=A0A447N5G7_SALET|nr:Uncharacterised protein [Salmonella enterica subsp. enterica]